MVAGKTDEALAWLGSRFTLESVNVGWWQIEPTPADLEEARLAAAAS